MVAKTVRVAHRLGIHARVAGAIVRLSGSFRSKITLQRNGTLASAKSIFELLLLGAGGGSEVLVSAVGEDEREALSAVEKLIAPRFQP